jgi:hypothetical protein
MPLSFAPLVMITSIGHVIKKTTRYCCLAKGTSDWFIGAITDEHARSTRLPLNFLDKGRSYECIIYADAANTDWKNNPEAYQIKKIIVTSLTSLDLKLAPGGGTAVSIKLLNR